MVAFFFQRTAPVSAETIEQKEKVTIPDNFSFAVLNTSEAEYEVFRDTFCELTICEKNLWSLCKNSTQVNDFISKIKDFTKIVLIGSGKFCSTIINEIHDRDQLLFVFIYCARVSRYEPLMSQYRKVRGVFHDLDILLKHLCKILEDELKVSQPDIPAPPTPTPVQPRLTLKQRGMLERGFVIIELLTLIKSTFTMIFSGTSCHSI